MSQYSRFEQAPINYNNDGQSLVRYGTILPATAAALNFTDKRSKSR